MASLTGSIAGSNIITTAAQAVGDPGAANVGRPRYAEFLRAGLIELCHDADWDRRYMDEAMPQDRILNMPRFVTGLRNIWGYNGGNCDIGPKANIYLKENYVHDGGTGSLAYNNYTNFNDVMQANVGAGAYAYGEPAALYYCGFVDGKLYLSPQCLQWERIRLEYNGIGTADFCQEDELCVPIWAKEAMEHYVTMRAAMHRIYGEGKQQLFWTLYKEMKAEYQGDNGSWLKARVRWSNMDHKDRQDTALFISRLGYPV